jgi:hypothetical protein
MIVIAYHVRPAFLADHVSFNKNFQAIAVWLQAGSALCRFRVTKGTHDKATSRILYLRQAQQINELPREKFLSRHL